MTPWIVVTVVAVGALVLVAATLGIGGAVRRRTATRPSWEIPQPEELRRVRFPVVWQGYDPETVDTTLDALFESYEELYFATGPAGIRTAQENLAVRRGLVRPDRLRDVRNTLSAEGPGSVDGEDAEGADRLVEEDLDRAVLREADRS